MEILHNNFRGDILHNNIIGDDMGVAIKPYTKDNLTPAPETKKSNKTVMIIGGLVILGFLISGSFLK